MKKDLLIQNSIQFKKGDRLILKNRILNGKIIEEHWIWNCNKVNKEYKDVLCCVQNEICTVVKVNKTNGKIQLFNEKRKIFFKIDKVKIKESEYNFKKV